jgi:hypothetical protein
VRPAEALDIHTRVLATMASTRTRVSATKALVQPSELGSYVDYLATYQLPEISKRLERNRNQIDGTTGLGPLSEFVAHTIKVSQTFMVSADVVGEIQAVADAIDDNDLIGNYRPPVPFGFAVLEKPLPFKDHRGLGAHIDMVGWGETVITVPKLGDMATSLVTLWSDGNRVSSEMIQMLFEGMAAERGYDMAKEFQGFYPLNLINLRAHDEMGPAWHLMGPDLIESDEIDLALMASKGVTPETAKIFNLDRLVCALWELMNRIPEAEAAETEPVERHARKRAQASGRASATVRAVRLHSPVRPVDPDRPKGESGWTPPDHVVAVRGHWRNQVCGPGRKDRKRIWVEEYKWNEDAENPAPATPTVYVVK